MTPFLKSVAKAFCSNYDDMSEFCFVFPNKRSGTFFQKYLLETIDIDDKAAIAPHISTITDFVALLSNRVVDNRIDLLFSLYNEYNQLVEDEIDFDRFRAWGDVVIADFSDIDMYGVNPDAIFSNVENYREIQSTFISDEQRKVIQDYFGNKQPWHDIDSFWIHYNRRDKKSSDSATKPNFMKIWHLLAPLYHNLNRTLDKKGLCYTGAAYRIALQNIKENGIKAIPYKKIIFVGFNALSYVELKIFQTLRDMSVVENGVEVPLTDFYWDAPGPAFKDKINTATRFIDKNKSLFKSHLSIDDDDLNSFPDKINAIGCPSNSAQTKEIGNIIESIASKISAENIHQAKVAIVLPDEGLLLPMLYSLPGSIKEVNLTMGYPLKLTSVASFISIIKKLQLRKRISNDQNVFFHEDLKAFLSHPYTRLLIGSQSIDILKNYIAEHRLFSVDASLLHSLAENADFIFAPLLKDESPDVICNYLITILTAIKNNIPNAGTGLIKSNIDISNIDTYCNAIYRLQNAINEHKILMNYASVFSLTDRLLAGETITFEGEPLQGLQIMGVLETRCLDFDYIVIPSMNERIFPRKMKRRTFIPNTLRRGFGMATTQFQESIFAYYFYRMISRAKEVFLLYDARMSGVKSGDVSRYLLQIKYLFKSADLKWSTKNFSVTSSDNNAIEIKKTPEILQLLKKYTVDDENRKNLSPSAIKNYIDCPVKFYLQNLKNITIEPEPDEFMDAITQGNIFHAVMQNIYTPNDLAGKKLNNPIRITSEFIDNILKNENILKTKIARQINLQYIKTKNLEAPIEGDAKIFADVLLKFVKWTLEADKLISPFNYLGSEVPIKTQLKIDDDLKVNFHFIIDRLDEINIDTNPLLRIVDYKTGADDIDCSKIEDLFNPGSNKKAIRQLMIYANLYQSFFKHYDAIKLAVYKTRTLQINNFNTDILFAKKTIDDYRMLNKEGFMDMLSEKIKEIFNPDINFTQTANTDVCDFCDFKKICVQ